ncbi:MAG: cupin domain-containing protein [Gammaproteobacteria bacterium]|nr:cupin domain-containing protein [Gammaproteobacteria bacterium]
MTEEEFKQQLRNKGYGEPRTKEYAPNANEAQHTHDFSVLAMVTRGELTLAYEDGSTTYKPGECCELAAGTVHGEQAGANGATLLLGRK